MASTIVIRVDGTDITNKVLYDSASFESQMGALPGTFEFTIKDRARTLSYTTGAEVTLDVDGTRLFGGYLTQASRKFAFPVDITVPDASKVQTRQWVLRGVDYNVLFDKRVLRNPNDYEHHLKVYPAGSEIGALVKNPLCSKYLDIPSGFDTTTMVTATTTDAPDEEGTFVEQGSTWRKQMDDFSRWGVVYYINAQKQLYVKEVEESTAKWQFSDKPNRYPIPVGYEYLPTIGFRDGEFTEDGTLIVNDALVWGGSDLANGLVFARRTNDASITERGRWQIAENHVGEYKKQARVNARANVIVDGNVGGTGGLGDMTRGYVNPQRTAKVTWFSHLVPADPNLSNVKSHLRPGDITSFILYALGSDLAHPLILDLPLRSISITFPSLDPQGKAYVQFEGTFGLQLDDPWWLWKYLRDRNVQTAPPVVVSTTTTPVGDPGGSGTVPYGTTGTYSLLPAPDGTNKVFHLPNDATYLNGSTEIYVNGLRYFSPANYTESDPLTGEITFAVAPAVTDRISAMAVLSGSSNSTVPVPTTGFFIAPSGSDSTGNGSISSPWQTISKFLAKPPGPGDTLYCRGGTYGHTGNNFLTPTTSGSASGPITISAYPGDSPPIFHGDNGPFDNFMQFKGGVAYWVVDGLWTANDWLCTSFGVIVVYDGNANDGGAHDITIRNMHMVWKRFMTQQEHCIYLGAHANRITVEDCIFDGEWQNGDSNGGAGMNVGDHAPEPEAFLIQRNVFRGLSKGIYIWDSGRDNEYGTIIHNTFIRNSTHIRAGGHYTPLVVRNNAGENALSGPEWNFEDGNPSYTTADHNFWGQTFDGSYRLLPGNTGINAASDGTDAGAIDSIGTGGTTYYISPTGTNTGTGAIGNPWASISKFLSVAVNGDVLLCRGGTYAQSGNQGITITVPNVTIARYSTADVPRFNISRGTIGITPNASGLTLDGLTFVGPGADQYEGSFGVYGTGTYANLTVKHCTFTDFGFSAFYVLSSTGQANITITDNVMRRCTYTGITVQAVGGSILRNDIRDIGVQDTGTNDGAYRDAYGIAVTMEYGGTPSSDVLIQDNYVDHVPTWHGLDTHGGIRLRFIHNEVRNCARAIFITASADDRTEDAHDCEIAYNLCTDPLSAPSIPPATDHNVGITTYATHDCEVHHNVVGTAYPSITFDTGAASTNLNIHDNSRGETLP